MKTSLPIQSILYNPEIKYDYVDAYEENVTDVDIDNQELITAFFQSTPAWIIFTMQLRDKVTSLVGLKPMGNDIKTVKPPYHVNEYVGPFKIYDMRETPELLEVILGEDDKHLDFRMSIMLNKQDSSIKNTNKRLIISTVVLMKNSMGHRYFTVIKPIHRIIASTMAVKMKQRLMLQAKNE